MRNTVILRGDYETYSGVADASLIPGMLVEPTATGFRRHASAAGVAASLWVREQHENDGADLNTTIAQGDDVSVIGLQKGGKVNAYTTDTIAAGGYVESDGVGGVRARGSGIPLGIATKASDLSGDIGRVEIITI
jgi:hypothetical protein